MNPDNKWEGKIGHKSSLTFENILDKTPAHIFVKDKDNRYVWVNQTVCNFMKCKKEDLIGKTPIELFSREFSEARRKEDREILRTGKSIKNSLMHLRIKGQKKKWYLLSKIPYRNKKGDIEGIVGISIDIDNQKRKIELALRGINQEVEKIVKNTSSMVAILNSNARYEFVSPSHERILGWSSEDLLQESGFSFIHPDDVDHMAKALQKGLNNEVDEIKLSYRVLDKKGNVHYLEGMFDSVRNEEGELIKIVCIANDVCERRKTQEALSRSEKRYRDLFTKAPIGIFRTTSAGAALEINPVMVEMVGAKNTKDAINNFQDLAHDLYVYPERRKEFVESLVENGVVEDFVFRAKKRDGSLAWFKMNARISDRFPDGSFIIDGYTMDITAEKEAMKVLLERERLSAIGEVASGVAHDFNNSLQGILGNIELALLEPGMSKNALSYLKSIKNSAIDASSRIKQLQRLSGKKNVGRELQNLNINHVLEEAVDQTRHLWKNYAEKRGLRIEIVKNFVELPLTSGTPGELRSVFYNIIKNSVQAMPEGGKITIETGLDNSTSRIFIIIKDTGIGMREETKKRIFQPFYTTKRYSGGKGLGMSASYSIIKEHNGEIEVSRSEPGKGTSIRIWFPQKTSKESEKEKKEIPLSSIKILWVEDEKPVRNVLEKMLGVLKRNFDMVETGNRALKLLEKAKYDVLVTDLGMPEMNGWQLADTVSEKYPELLIVLVTGWDAEVTDNDLKNHNIFRVLGKPVGLTQINSLLAELKAELEKSEKN